MPGYRFANSPKMWEFLGMNAIGNKLDHVDYDSLDRAKNAFIEASRKTVKFAAKYGFIPDDKFGASSNVFALDLTQYLNSNNKKIYLTLVPEGLGTADDARPDDLTTEEAYRFWKNIGLKTVAVTTNDAASSGMQTILLGLYLPSSTPETIFTPEFMSGFLDGIVEGCKSVGCVYFSGETPQLKTKIYPDKLDIAGALFGLLPPGAEPLSGNIEPGNKIVFVESSGPGENGFTSLRELATKLPEGYRTKLPSGMQYWEAINKPSILYTPLIQELLAAGVAPISAQPVTGHGWQKIMRSAKPLKYVIEKMLPVHEIFKFIESATNTPPAEMIKIFNYGVGLTLFFVNDNEAARALQIIRAHKLECLLAGQVEESKTREVVVNPLKTVLSSENFALSA